MTPLTWFFLVLAFAALAAFVITEVRRRTLFKELLGRIEAIESGQQFYLKSLQQLNQTCSDLGAELERYGRRLRKLKEYQESFTQEFETLEQKLKMLSVPTEGAFLPVKSLENLNSPLVQEISEKLRAGKSVLDIAEETGLQVGEIELIRGLVFYHQKDRADS